MQSGIGDQTTLQRLGIPVLQHLPGVGENFQDHLAFDCVWEYQEALSPRNNMSEAIFFWGSKSGLHSPDFARCRVDTARGRRTPKKPRNSCATTKSWKRQSCSTRSAAKVIVPHAEHEPRFRVIRCTRTTRGVTLSFEAQASTRFRKSMMARSELRIAKPSL